LTLDPCVVDTKWTTADTQCYCLNSTDNTINELCSTNYTCSSSDYTCQSGSSVGNLKADFVGRSGKVHFYDSTSSDASTSGFVVTWNKCAEKSSMDANNFVSQSGAMASSDFVYTSDSTKTTISTTLKVGSGNNATNVHYSASFWFFDKAGTNPSDSTKTVPANSMKFSLQIGDASTKWPESSTSNVIEFSFKVQVSNSSTPTWDNTTGTIKFGD